MKRVKKMKILAICSSAKNGNTYSVLNSIKENYPSIDFKILMLKDVNLERCLGCYSCIRLGEKNCPLKDDRDTIINEILESDGVVFASPVYVNSATSLMKIFIERTGYEGHRPRFYDKFAMTIAVCGMFGAKETNQFMTDIFTQYGFNFVSSLELQVATKTEKETLYNHKLIIEAFDAFIDKIEKGERNKPSMGQLVRFNLFKLISEHQKDYFKADYEYYKDKSDIPYDGKISSAKKKLAYIQAGKMLNDFMKVR